MKKTYKNKQFFDGDAYESFKNNVANSAMSGDSKMLKVKSMVERIENSMKEYVDFVDSCETRIKTARFRLEGDDFRDVVESIDRTRKATHDAVISGVAILNRFSRDMGFSPIFIGDASVREQIADFCIEVGKAIFDYVEDGD